jgi:hypothetical protein
MCQWGAYEYSRIGWTYLQILDHYYNLDWYYDYGEGRLVEEEAPPTPEPVPEVPSYNTFLYDLLEGISQIFFHIAGRLGTLADAVKNVGIIGPLFYIPLDFFATRADDAWLVCHDIAVRTNDYHRFVTDLLQGTLFHTLLLAKIPSIGGLLADPVSWVRNQVNSILGELQRLRDNPTSWILERVYDWFPWFRNFIDDPGGYILSTLRTIRPGMLELVEEPLGYVLKVINALFPRAMDFFRDPEGWLKAKIAQWLGASSALWSYGWSYIWYKIMEVLNTWPTTYIPWIRSFGAKCLRYLFEGVWNE